GRRGVVVVLHAEADDAANALRIEARHPFGVDARAAIELARDLRLVRLDGIAQPEQLGEAERFAGADEQLVLDLGGVGDRLVLDDGDDLGELVAVRVLGRGGRFAVVQLAGDAVGGLLGFLLGGIAGLRDVVRAALRAGLRLRRIGRAVHAARAVGDVRELVRQQAIAVARAGREPSLAEVHVLAVGERLRPEIARRLGRRAVGVHLHARQIAADARLHARAHLGRERPAVRLRHACAARARRAVL